MDCLLVLRQRHHAPNFTEKTFENSHKTVKFAEVFSLKSFPLYGNNICLNYMYFHNSYGRRGLESI